MTPIPLRALDLNYLVKLHKNPSTTIPRASAQALLSHKLIRRNAAHGRWAITTTGRHIAVSPIYAS